MTRAPAATGWKRLALGFGAGLAVAGVLAGGLGLAVVEFGLYDTTARTPHSAFMEWAAHTTYKRFTRRTADIQAPPAPAAFSEAQVQAGLAQYRRDCLACHGGPGVGRAAWAQGMVPPPPYLLDVSKRYTPRQLYFILDRGVKMSAMPAWGEIRSPAELWNYVAILEKLPQMIAVQSSGQEPDTSPATPSHSKTEVPFPPA